MTPELVQWICCPACKGDLALTATKTSELGIEEGSLACAGCGQTYPVTCGVPRFVRSDGYVGSFSFEWNRWGRVQFDPANGTTESEDTFIEKTRFQPDDLRGKLVLDVGCGAGRFLDVASRWGARVIGVDFSFAVEASQRNLAARGNVDVIQADVFALPFRDHTFDVIFSIGVLHHTRDTREAFLNLPRLLKNEGQIAVWLYYYTDALYSRATDFWRAIFSRVPSRLAYAWCWMLVVLFSGLFQSKLMQRPPFWHLPRVLPVNTHRDFHWRVLDTFDWWTPRYQDKDCSPARVVGWFKEAGLRGIDVIDYPTSVRGVRDEEGRLPVLESSVPALDNTRFVVFGSGQGGHQAIRRLEQVGLADRVVAVCDNNPAKHGTRVYGVPVVAFEALSRDAFDYVIVASLPGKQAIGQQLQAAGLVPKRDFGPIEYVADVALPIWRAAA